MAVAEIVKFQHSFEFSTEQEQQQGEKRKQRKQLPPLCLVNSGSYIELVPMILLNGASEEDPEGTVPQVYIGFRNIEDAQRKGKISFKVAVRSPGENTRNTFLTETRFPSDDIFLRLAPLESDNESPSQSTSAKKFSVSIKFSVSASLFDLQPLLISPSENLAISEAMYADLQAPPGSKRKSMADFAIISELDNQRYSCHRCVLSCASEYFRTIVFERGNVILSDDAEFHLDMLNSCANEYRPKNSGNIVCNPYKAEAYLPYSGATIREILHWIYLGKASPHFNASVVDPILMAADFLRMEDHLKAIRPVAEKLLVNSTDANNAWQRLLLAEKFDFKVLENRAMALLKDNPSVVENAAARGKKSLMKVALFMQEALRAPRISPP